MWCLRVAAVACVATLVADAVPVHSHLRRQLPITSGNATAVAEGAFGFQVSLRGLPDPVNHPEGNHLCGGTLLTRDYVVTRAHCISDSADPAVYAVFIGGTRLVGNDSGVRRTLSSMAVHPLYAAGNTGYDVALLRLATPYDGVEAEVANATIGNFGANLRVMGWGVNDLAHPAIQPTLGTTIVTVRSNKVCQDLYGSAFNASLHLCANGPGGEGACLGDDGGPLIRWANGPMFYVIGFPVPAGGCGSPAFPGIYLRLAAVQGWLKSIIGGPLSTPDILWKGNKGQQVVDMGALATNSIKVSRGGLPSSSPEVIIQLDPNVNQAAFAALPAGSGLFLQVSTCGPPTAATFDTVMYMQGPNPYRVGVVGSALVFDDNCDITGSQAAIPGQRTSSLGRIRLLSPNDAPYIVIEARAGVGARLGQFPFQWRTVTLPLGTTVPERRPRL